MKSNNKKSYRKGVRTHKQRYQYVPNPGLSAYLHRVLIGTDQVYRTTFYNNKKIHRPVARVLGDWDVTLKQIAHKYPELYEFEQDLRKKVGPMSVMKPLNDRMNDVDHYYDDILLPSKPIDPRAIAQVVSEWAPEGHGLRIKSRDDTIDDMKLSTNSGLPFFMKRRDQLDLTNYTISFPSDRIHYDMKDASMSGIYDDCAVLGWRGQEGGADVDDIKQRVVWMMPMEVNIRELSVYQAVITWCQEQGLVPAWIGMDDVDFSITRLFDTKDPSDVVICTDFSKFDQHFNGDMSNAAASIIHSMFAQDPAIEDWLDHIFPIKYRIPLMLQENMVRTGNHGMASGSGGTNADETLAHRALQHEAALLHHANLNPYSMCLGDDGVLSYPGINVDDVLDTYTSHGQEMNSSKQYVSDHDCVYLRRWHSTEYRINGICVGVYATHRALGRLMFQERFYSNDIWNNKMVALRQLSILENCKYHPLFEEFVQYCMKGDRWRLGLDIPGFLDNITSIAEEAIDHIPDFMGYTQSLEFDNKGLGIANWRVVKYLKALKK